MNGEIRYTSGLASGGLIDGTGGFPAFLCVRVERSCVLSFNQWLNSGPVQSGFKSREYEVVRTMAIPERLFN